MAITLTPDALCALTDIEFFMNAKVRNTIDISVGEDEEPLNLLTKTISVVMK